MTTHRLIMIGPQIGPWNMVDVAFQLSCSVKPPIAFTTEKMGRKHVSSLAFILPLLASTADAASEPARPRGVGPECMFIQ